MVSVPLQARTVGSVASQERTRTQKAKAMLPGLGALLLQLGLQRSGLGPVDEQCHRLGFKQARKRPFQNCQRCAPATAPAYDFA